MSDRTAELVVMTQNAWGGGPLWPDRERRLADILQRRAPTVLGLQEIRAASTSGDESQAHQLARRAGGYRALFWPGQVEDDGRCEGNALLVRDEVEVLDRASRWLTLDEDDPLDRVTRRVVARTTLRCAGQVVDVIVAHMPISRRARTRTVHELLGFAAEGREASRSHGAVLVGDLNAAPGEVSIRALSNEWTDAWRSAHPHALGGTWPSVSPFLRIDYVFVQPGKGWTTSACERAPFAGSDHLGLLATLALPG